MLRGCWLASICCRMRICRLVSSSSAWSWLTRESLSLSSDDSASEWDRLCVDADADADAAALLALEIVREDDLVSRRGSYRHSVGWPALTQRPHAGRSLSQARLPLRHGMHDFGMRMRVRLAGGADSISMLRDVCHLNDGGGDGGKDDGSVRCQSAAKLRWRESAKMPKSTNAEFRHSPTAYARSSQFPSRV